MLSKEVSQNPLKEIIQDLCKTYQLLGQGNGQMVKFSDILGSEYIPDQVVCINPGPLRAP